jgi:L-threonylcarbamoyladenylate synthase
VAYPTETFYALGANPFDLVACRQVSLLKKRDPAKAFPLILAEPKQLDLLCDIVPRNLSRLAERFWPGPLTVVVAAREKLPGTLLGQRTVAVRVSAMIIARSLAREAGFPLVATSANQGGRSPAQTAQEVQIAFGAGVDLILDGGTTPGGGPRRS